MYSSCIITDFMQALNSFPSLRCRELRKYDFGKWLTSGPYDSADFARFRSTLSSVYTRSIRDVSQIYRSSVGTYNKVEDERQRWRLADDWWRPDVTIHIFVRSLLIAEMTSWYARRCLGDVYLCAAHLQEIDPTLFLPDIYLYLQQKNSIIDWPRKDERLSWV